ncbi:MAG: hypothetical protein HYS98_05135 [Deltaproteobacteria bacterium]|nr:hypothetical protein [Deltaproteobacteria bacterium]
MSPQSDKSIQWRSIHKSEIEEWRRQFEELKDFAIRAGFSQEKFETELAQLIDDADLRDFWFFANSYVNTHRGTKFSKFLNEAISEIRSFGIVEPSRRNRLIKSMKTTRRKVESRKR